MEHTEKKLQTFKETVMRDAEQKKEEIVKEMQQVRQQAVSQAENEFLEKAYATIQREKTAIIREKNERISKALADSKRTLLQERETILNQVFAFLYERIDQYRTTQEYRDYMINLIQAGLKSVGEGEVVVFLDQRDDALKQELADKLHCQTQTDSLDIIGGCRVINRTKNIICDNSLIERISEMKGSFLEETGLFI